jgi:hypothetical protein
VLYLLLPLLLPVLALCLPWLSLTSSLLYLQSTNSTVCNTLVTQIQRYRNTCCLQTTPALGSWQTFPSKNAPGFSVASTCPSTALGLLVSAQTPRVPDRR